MIYIVNLIFTYTVYSIPVYFLDFGDFILNLMLENSYIMIFFGQITIPDGDSCDNGEDVVPLRDPGFKLLMYRERGGVS
jgi:hypothetical protein